MYAKTVSVHRNGLLMGFDGPPLMGCVLGWALGRGSGPICAMQRSTPALGLTDMSTGLYLHGAIIAAVYARRDTGRGQKIDTSLFDRQVSLLSNVARFWLNAGELVKRWGIEHPRIVPYQAFKTKDSHLLLGATKNRQFQTLCHLMKLSGWPTDLRFFDNSSRVQNRAELKRILEPIVSANETEWLAGWLRG